MVLPEKQKHVNETEQGTQKWTHRNISNWILTEEQKHFKNGGIDFLLNDTGVTEHPDKKLILT